MSFEFVQTALRRLRSMKPGQELLTEWRDWDEDRDAVQLTAGVNKVNDGRIQKRLIVRKLWRNWPVKRSKDQEPGFQIFCQTRVKDSNSWRHPLRNFFSYHVTVPIAYHTGEKLNGEPDAAKAMTPEAFVLKRLASFDRFGFDEKRSIDWLIDGIDRHTLLGEDISNTLSSLEKSLEMSLLLEAEQERQEREKAFKGKRGRHYRTFLSPHND